MQPTEFCALVGSIDPGAYGAATYTSDAANMRDYQKIMAVLSVTTIGASGTVDAKLEQATAAGVTYKDVAREFITIDQRLWDG